MKCWLHKSVYFSRHKGFSLVEVTVAMGIFFICIIALIDLTRQSLMMSRDLEFVEPDVGWVAAELSLTNKVEDGLMETGDFGEYYAGWSWQREVRMYPPLDELGGDLDDIGLYQVDIQVNGPGGSQTHSVLMYRGAQDNGNGVSRSRTGSARSSSRSRTSSSRSRRP